MNLPAPGDAFSKLGKKIRLDRLLSQQGLCSRREAREFIRQGRLRLPGNVKALGPGQRVFMRHGDVFTLDREQYLYRPYVYLMLNKPPGYEVTARSTKRKVVQTLLSGDLMSRSSGAPTAVGRLKVENSGLLFLTDDKMFSRHLAMNEVSNTWELTLHTPPSDEQLQQLLDGVPLRRFGEDLAQVTHIAQSGSDGKKWEFSVDTNKYFETLLKVVKLEPLHLRRLSIGRVHLPHDLEEGDYRLMESDHIKLLDYEPSWDPRPALRMDRWKASRTAKRMSERRAERETEAGYDPEAQRRGGGRLLTDGSESGPGGGESAGQGDFSRVAHERRLRESL